MGEAQGFDEFRDAEGSPRSHQRPLDAFMSARSPADLEQLRQLVRRRITEQEVTFNILGVPEGTNRPWQLDVVPHVVDRAEWTKLAEGLSQRARLLEAVLADVYGPQRLLRKGILPAEIVYESARFLRPMAGHNPPRGAYLILYAADLARTAEGRFCVFSDRTAAPTGAGYALENRLVLGRVLGELFREYGVERLSDFFGKVRRALEELAPNGTREPRIVLLSPGVRDESSFEHAYLSRYLGFELVEGRDLTIRGDGVFLKTLSGLSRVDVVLRRTFDEWCDPLYLRPDSTQGVAGIVSAALAGKVSLANPLGSGFAETPALRSYIPRLARELLGEDLLLDDVPCHWCGEESALAEVLSRPDDFVLKPAFGERRGDAVRFRDLAAAAKERWLRRLRGRPTRYVAEAWPAVSTAPFWKGAELAQGAVALRAFLCKDGKDYAVMPGGLARLDAAPDGLFLSLGGNGVSKDVWVPDDATRERAPLPAMPDARVELRRGGVDLPSRLLDDIFWLGRYVERCDATARLIRAGLERLGLEAGADAPRARGAIENALREVEALPRGTLSDGNGAAQDPESRLIEAVHATNLSGSLLSVLQRIHGLTLSVRSRLSRDAWHVLRRLTSTLNGPHAPLVPGRVGSTIELLDQLLVTLAAVSGTMFDNMVRGHVWVFLDMGRRVERGSLTLTLLRTLLPEGASRVHMEALLEVADSLLTYRARYLSALQAAPVVDLLLTDDTNPRSVAFQVHVLAEHLDKLPRPGGAARSRAERRLIALGAQLLTADVEEATSGDGSGLRQLVEDATTLLWQFSDDLSNNWFSHAAPPRPVAPPEWVDEDLETE